MKPLLTFSALLLASTSVAYSQGAATPAPEAPPPGVDLPDGTIVPESGATAANDDLLGGANSLLNKLAGDVNISSTGGAEVLDFQKGIFRYKGGVNIKYHGVEILGDGAEFNRATGDITVRGDVSIFREGILYKGTSAVYNIKTDSIRNRKIYLLNINLIFIIKNNILIFIRYIIHSYIYFF